MKTLTSLTMFFPAYNDEHTIGDLVSRAYTVGLSLTKQLEVIVVNDGSTDNTGKILNKLTEKFPRFRSITHKTNRGYGAALISGITGASNDWVFYTDGDGQYDPAEIQKLVAALDTSIDIVNGYKQKRSDSLVRIMFGSVYNLFAHRRFRLPIRDVDCDFRLMRRSLLKNIHLTSQSGTICVELISKLYASGARFREVPVNHYPRRFGHSQFFQLKHLVTTLKEFWEPPKE